MIPIAILFAAILLGLFPFLLIRVLTPLKRMKEHQSECAEKYFAASQRVVADESIDQTQKTLLVTLSKAFDRPAVIRHVLIEWLLGEFSRNGSKGNKLDDALKGLSEDSRHAFLVALATGILAATYAAPISGAILRHLLFAPLRMAQRPESAPPFALAIAHDDRIDGAFARA